MKILLTAALLASAASFCGCASTSSAPTPAPQSAQTRPVQSPGRLVVYTAFETSPEFYPSTPYHRAYSNYQILSSDGKPVQKVHNDAGDAFGGPASVTLPPGNYRIVAHAEGHGTVTVPVAIAADRTTTIRLDAGYPLPSDTAASGTAQTNKP